MEVAPLAFMRGRTLNDAFVILDEAQNTTVEQMKMFLTRLGFHSKAVITGRRHAGGPPARAVLPASPTRRRYSADVPGIAFTYFTELDVVRHPLVQAVIRAYAKDEADAQARRAEEAQSPGEVPKAQEETPGPGPGPAPAVGPA